MNKTYNFKSIKKFTGYDKPQDFNSLLENINCFNSLVTTDIFSEFKEDMVNEIIDIIKNSQNPDYSMIESDIKNVDYQFTKLINHFGQFIADNFNVKPENKTKKKSDYNDNLCNYFGVVSRDKPVKKTTPKKAKKVIEIMAPEYEESYKKDLEKMKIYQLATEICKQWKPVHFSAVPYLIDMLKIADLSGNYGYDSKKSIVLYFLANATTFKGEYARAIKKELNKRVKETK
jgi:hypothetical protein